MRIHKRWFSIVCKGMSLLMVLCILTFFCGTIVYAKPVSSGSHVDEIEGSSTGGVSDPEDPDNFEFNISSNAGSSSLSASLQMLLVLTVLSIAPSILIMMTSFTRIIVVLHFVRSALGTQQTPPNQVMTGLALFLTLFIMAPVISDVNTNCVQPYQAGQITQEEALNAGLKPIREFMFEQTNRSDIKLFLDIEGEEREINSEEDIPTMVLMPAFMISELRTAFIIGGSSQKFFQSVFSALCLDISCIYMPSALTATTFLSLVLYIFPHHFIRFTISLTDIAGSPQGILRNVSGM